MPKKKKKSKAIRSNSISSRATNLRKAAGNKKSVVVSKGATTAIDSTGSLKKIGNTVGQVANIASKFLPGVGGVVAKGIADIFNDPEWWQSVPGTEISTNESLQQIKVGTARLISMGNTPVELYHVRPAILDIYSTNGVPNTFMNMSDAAVTSYLMPAIRKQVNAVPLQPAGTYKAVVTAAAALYAFHHQLLKMRYLMEHGTTYLPSCDDSAFPMLQLTNKANLDALIERTKELLRASVRLPHTLCEYLAWRYGRIYRSTNSAKSAFIVYNVVSFTSSLAAYQAMITNIQLIFSSNQYNQAALTDLYNTFNSHDQAVIIRDDTQMSYDKKEFLLRTNLEIDQSDAMVLTGTATETAFKTSVSGYYSETNPILLDSTLDNRTTFMASTVSERGAETPLFPVAGAVAYIFDKTNAPMQLYGVNYATNPNGSTDWYAVFIHQTFLFAQTGTTGSTIKIDNLLTIVGMYMICKALDFYNVGIYLESTTTNTTITATNVVPGTGAKLVDLTALSSDLAVATDLTVTTEQLFAFANLMDNSRQHSESYNAAQKEVATQVADLIEDLNVTVTK